MSLEPMSRPKPVEQPPIVTPARDERDGDEHGGHDTHVRSSVTYARLLVAPRPPGPFGSTLRLTRGQHLRPLAITGAERAESPQASWVQAFRSDARAQRGEWRAPGERTGGS